MQNTSQAVHGRSSAFLKPLNAELNPICHLLALLGAHLIFHVSRIRVNAAARGAKRNIWSLQDYVLNIELFL
jgi:transposase